MTTSSRNAPKATAHCFESKNGKPINQQIIDQVVRRIAAHANSKLPKEQQIELSPHLLRHTRFAAGRRRRAFATPGRYPARSPTATSGDTPSPPGKKPATPWRSSGISRGPLVRISNAMCPRSCFRATNRIQR